VWTIAYRATTAHDPTRTEGNDSLTASLFVRSLSPEGARAEQDLVIDRLRTLQDRGVLADLSLTIWGSRLRSSSARRTETGRELLDAIDRLEAWADRQEPSRSLCFDSRAVRSTITGGRETELVLPLMCLAVSENDRLQCVAPWCEGEVVRTVTDCLDAISDPTAIDAHPPTEDVDPLLQ
jgi:hypothetical protein